MKAPRIEEDYTSYFPNMAIETVWDVLKVSLFMILQMITQTIDGEIVFHERNYTNAFVHAFVDGNRIIETARQITYLGVQVHMEINVLSMLKSSIHMIMIHLHVQ